MVITIKKVIINKPPYLESQYQADLLDLPGMPPIGLGDSPEEAVANLFYKLAYRDGTLSFNWKECVGWDKCRIIRL